MALSFQSCKAVAENQLGIILPDRAIVSTYSVSYGKRGEFNILISDIMRFMGITDRNYFKTKGFEYTDSNSYMTLYLKEV